MTQQSGNTPIDFSGFIADRTKDFTGREWVFAKINAWLADPVGSRTFLLVGGPGTGKSAILARLTQFHLGQASVDDCPGLVPNFLAYHHFCQAQQDATLNPLRFVEALSRALAGCNQDFAQRLVELTQGDQNITINATQTVTTASDGSRVQNVVIQNLNVGNASARVAFDRIVRRPLEALSRDNCLGPIVILVDSLDEARTWKEDENVLTLLAETLDDQRDLPAQVRFILSSRLDDRVFSTIGLQPSLDLIADARPDLQEVCLYASTRLAGASLDADLQNRLATRVADASAGNFLYARYVLDDWLARPAEITLESALDLPDKLSGIYRQFLKRELARDNEKWGDRYQPLLGLLAVAHGEGLTAEQLAGASGLQRSQADSALRTCDQYLAGPRPNGPFRVYHQSFRDFLLEDATYKVYPAEANQSIAKYLLDEYEDAWLECKDTYALQYAPTHLLDAASMTDRQQRTALVRTLVALVTNLGFCEAKTRRFGVFAALDDIQLAQRPDLSDVAVQVGLPDLLKVLRREAHALRSWDPERFPTFFAQQIGNRARGLGFDSIANAAQHRLQGLNLPHLELKWLAARQSPELENVLVGHEDFIQRVALTADGRLVVSADLQGILKLWNVDTGQEIWSLKAQDWQDCSCVAVTPDNRLVVAGGSDGKLSAWGLTNRSTMRVFSVGKGEITALAATDITVYAVSDEEGLTAWDPQTWKAVSLPMTAAILRGIRLITRDGRYGLAGPVRDRITIWELDTGRRVCHLGLNEKPSVMAVSPDGRTGVFGIGEYDEMRLLIYDLSTGELARTVPIALERSPLGDDACVTAVALAPNSNRIIASTSYPTILVYDLSSGELVRSLIGHQPSLEGGVNDLALSADGRRLVSAGIDKTLLIWNLDTTGEDTIRRGHKARIIDLVMASDGAQGVTASEDLTFKFWHVDSGSEIRSLPFNVEGEDRADAVAVVPDRSLAFSAGNALLELDLTTGQVTSEIPFPVGGRGRTYTDHASGYLGAVTWVAVDHSGQFMLDAFYPDGRARCETWDLESGSYQACFRGPEVNRMEGSIRAGSAPLVAFLSDGRHAVYAKDTRLVIHDLQEGADIGELAPVDTKVTSIATTPDGHFVLVGTESGTLLEWEFSSRKFVLSIPALKSPLRDLAVTPDGCRAVARADDGALKTWNLSNGSVDLILKPTDILYVVEEGSQVRHACCRSDKSTVSIYDLQTGQVIGKMPYPTQARVRAVSPDHRYVLVSISNQGLQLWHLPDGEPAKLIMSTETTCAVFTTDSQWLLCGLADGSLQSRNLANGQTAWSELLHGAGVVALAIAPDGSLAISADKDGTVKGWNPITGQEQFAFTGPVDPPQASLWRLELIGNGRVNVFYPPAPPGRFVIQGWDHEKREGLFSLESDIQLLIQLLGNEPPLRATFSSDGSSVIYPSGPGELCVWNFREQTEVARLKLGSPSGVLCLNVSHDGRVVVAGMEDGHLRLWRGKQVRNLDKHASAVLAVAFTPDSQRVISGSSDRTLRVSDPRTGAEVVSVAVDGAVERLAVAPDSKTILAGDRVGNVYCFGLMEPGVSVR